MLTFTTKCLPHIDPEQSLANNTFQLYFYTPRYFTHHSKGTATTAVATAFNGSTRFCKQSLEHQPSKARGHVTNFNCVMTCVLSCNLLNQSLNKYKTSHTRDLRNLLQAQYLFTKSSPIREICTLRKNKVFWPSSCIHKQETPKWSEEDGLYWKAVKCTRHRHQIAPNHSGDDACTVRRTK